MSFNNGIEKSIRMEIFEKVRLLYQMRKEREKFISGKSRINYAGIIYDENEIMSLIDVALDFRLAISRCAKQFEEELAKFIGLRYCLLTNSGSSANLLAISALTSSKLGEKRLVKGDEVITVACGFPTTLNPIVQNNLIPVFIDVEIGTYNIQADEIENAITDKTKAIFIPHTLGIPAEMSKISRIVNEHDLWLVEDNCDALGSMYMGKYTGSFGHISTCSFYPAHHITLGEGGAVLTDDPLLRSIIASFRDWGRDCWCNPGTDDTCKKRFKWALGSLPYGYDHKYIYSHIGYNLKATEMQAAIGVEQLKKLPAIITKRKENFKIIYDMLKNYQEFIILPHRPDHSDPCWFGFPIFVKSDAPFSRSDIVNYLESRGIATRMLFGGNLTRQPAYEGMNYRVVGTLKNTDLIMENLFWVGVYPGLTEDMLCYIRSTFREFFQEIMTPK